MARKTVLALVSFGACVGVVSSAHAAPASQKIVKVNGTVSSICSSGDTTGSFVLNTTVPANGKVDPTLNGRTFTMNGAWCDSGSVIQLKATGLRRVPPNSKVPNGQSQTTNFKATATGWSMIPATVMTAETDPYGTTNYYFGTPQRLNSAKIGPITITLSGFGDPNFVLGSNGLGWKLMDGNYQATIVVMLAPAS